MWKWGPPTRKKVRGRKGGTPPPKNPENPEKEVSNKVNPGLTPLKMIPGIKIRSRSNFPRHPKNPQTS